MTFISKPGTIIKIQMLENSQARDYLESKERLFLRTVLETLQNNPNEMPLNNKQINELQTIFTKYQKYLKT